MTTLYPFFLEASLSSLFSLFSSPFGHNPNEQAPTHGYSIEVKPFIPRYEQCTDSHESAHRGNTVKTLSRQVDKGRRLDSKHPRRTG